MMKSTFLVLLSLLSLATATPSGIIQGTLRLPDERPVNTTKIALNDGERITYTKLDGSFVFYNVPPGVHLLDVHSMKHHFGQVKVQLLEESMDQPKCIEYAFPGAPKQVIKHPIELKAHATIQYFEKKKGFSIASIFANPMLLMMLFSVGMMFFMPKMMEGLEPEERERMQKQMASQQDPTKMLSNLWSDLQGGGQEPEKTIKKKK